MIRAALIGLLVVDSAVMSVLGIALITGRSSSQVDRPTTGMPQSSPAVSPAQSNDQPSDAVKPVETPADSMPQPPTRGDRVVIPHQEPFKEKPRDWNNIEFTFRNSRAQEVWLIGDFNQWKKGVDRFTLDLDRATWKCLKRLKNGTYAYGYWVDGRTIMDPNNPRRDGRKSILILPKPKTSS